VIDESRRIDRDGPGSAGGSPWKFVAKDRAFGIAESYLLSTN
jgi:hypothetical protein